MKRFLLGILLVSYIAVCGCVQETNEFFINPDGSGKVIHELTEESMDGGMFSMQGAQSDPNEQLNKTVVGILTESKGVDAWRDVEYGLTKEGKIHFKGTAYFADITKVDFEGGLEIDTGNGEEGGNSIIFNKNPDGTIAIEFKMQESDGQNESEVAVPDMNDKELNDMIMKQKMQYQQMKMMMGNKISSLKMENIFHLPGEITKSTNFEKIDDRTVRIVITGEKIIKAFDSIMADDELLKEMIRTGKNPNSDMNPSEMNEKVFGEKGPITVIAEANEPLFNYKRELDLARRKYKALIKELNLQVVDTQNVVGQMREAFKKMRADEYEDAIKLFLSVTANEKATDKQLVKSYSRLGQCYIKLENYEKAREVFEKIISDYPKEKLYIKRAKSMLKKMESAREEESEYEGDMD